MPRCKSRAHKIIARSNQLHHAFEAEIDDRFNLIASTPGPVRRGLRQWPA